MKFTYIFALVAVASAGQLMGGTSDMKPITDSTLQAQLDSYQPLVENAVHKSYGTFKAISYAT